MHLSPEFGSTVQKIEADGYRLIVRLKCCSVRYTCWHYEVGLGLIGFADVFDELADLLLILEVLDSPQLRSINRPSLLRIFMGRATEGQLVMLLYSIKMSHIHFVAADGIAIESYSWVNNLKMYTMLGVRCRWYLVSGFLSITIRG